MSAKRNLNDPAPEEEEPSGNAFEGDSRRAELIRFFAELSRLFEQPQRERRKITELRGLGKEIWRGVDAQEYVDAERESWGN